MTPMLFTYIIEFGGQNVLKAKAKNSGPYLKK